MVSLITQGSPTDRNGKPFPRRRPRPIGILLAVLALLAVIVWVKALTGDAGDSTPMSCNAPRAQAPGTNGPVLGQRAGASALSDVEPAALASTQIRVYNANGGSGQAEHIASELNDLGFVSAPDVQFGNDPIYVNGDVLQCTGQIRYGKPGEPAAAALQLAVPCAELIEDQRTDPTVDLALGTEFGQINPNPDADEVLRSLRQTPAGQAPPQDNKLLSAARSAKC